MVPMCFPEGVTPPTLGVVMLVGVLTRMLVPVVVEAVVRWVAIFSTRNQRAERALRVLQVRHGGDEGSNQTSGEVD